MRLEGKKTQKQNAKIDSDIRATKVDIALQQFAECLCKGYFDEAGEWMDLARKILREHNSYDAVVHTTVGDPVRYVLNRERVPESGNGVVVLNRNVQSKLKSVLSDSERTEFVYA